MTETPHDAIPAASESAFPIEKRRRYLWLKIPALIVIGVIVFEVLFLAWYFIVPPWQHMRDGKIPASALITDYKAKLAGDAKLPPLRWTPLVASLPKKITQVFILAEDSRFYEHDGFDYAAIEKAIEYNWRKGKVVRGASTISQQTAKNLFLSLSRNPFRKWHEVLLTYLLEAKLSKPQILHAYLNIAEFGPGIYGIEAAAKAYFHRPAARLSQEQAIQLAASLPSPKKHNPKSATRAFQQRTRRVASAIRLVDRYTLQSGKKSSGKGSALPTSDELAEKLREVMADPQGDRVEMSGEELDALELVPSQATHDKPLAEPSDDGILETTPSPVVPTIDDVPTPGSEPDKETSTETDTESKGKTTITPSDTLESTLP